MKTISRVFPTLAKASAFQQRLYGKYDVVRLIRSPTIGESGTYAWRVEHDRTAHR